VTALYDTACDWIPIPDEPGLWLNARLLVNVHYTQDPDPYIGEYISGADLEDWEGDLDVVDADDHVVRALGSYEELLRATRQVDWVAVAEELMR